MRVLVADSLPEEIIDSLRSKGHVITVQDCAGEDLRRMLVSTDAESLVVKSTKVTKEILTHAPSLELIVRAGAGFDTIDIDAASELGIFVANCPGKNATAVAELTIGLIVALDRRIPDNVIDARSGRWQKGLYGKGRGLKGQVLGLIGLGHIGLLVARMASSMGLNICAWSRSLTPEKAASLGIHYLDSPLKVASNADIISFHVAANQDTFQLANQNFFDAIKPGALLINTSRGSVIDETSLLKALDTKGIRVALDVFVDEPLGKEGTLETPLIHHPNVYLTHHIGASTDQAQIATGEEVVRIIHAYHQTGIVHNCVNIAEQSSATHVLTVRHLDKVGVLANVLNLVRKYHLNIQEMENQVFTGKVNAAVARIRVVGTPSEDLCSLLKETPDILAVSQIKL
ncbi:MAG: NAD(P)-binding domain-containing protein [Bacteroidetes bacterium]|nr:NAD(P)-binding domain-containing protein [Bacteroidota bacterium]